MRRGLRFRRLNGHPREGRDARTCLPRCRPWPRTGRWWWRRIWKRRTPELSGEPFRRCGRFGRSRCGRRCRDATHGRGARLVRRRRYSPLTPPRIGHLRRAERCRGIGVGRADGSGCSIRTRAGRNSARLKLCRDVRDAAREHERAHVLAFVTRCFSCATEPTQRLLSIALSAEHGGRLQRRDYCLCILGSRLGNFHRGVRSLNGEREEAGSARHALAAIPVLRADLGAVTGGALTVDFSGGLGACKVHDARHLCRDAPQRKSTCSNGTVRSQRAGPLFDYQASIPTPRHEFDPNSRRWMLNARAAEGVTAPVRASNGR